MSRWFFMAVVFLLFPLTMIIFGLWFRFRPPGRPKEKEKEAVWKFAQNHLGRTWLILGGPMLAVSTAVLLLVRGSGQPVILTVGIILNTIQTIILFTSSLPAQISMRRHFDEEGNPRDASTQDEIQNPD